MSLIGDMIQLNLKDYFSLWRFNFKNSLIIWLILLPCLAAMLIFTMYIAQHTQNLAALILYFAFFIILAFILAYIFPLQATFINTPLKLLRNSLLTALAHLPYTLILIFTTTLPVCITLCFPAVFYYTCAYWLLFGFSITAVISVILTNKVFQYYITNDE